MPQIFVIYFCNVSMVSIYLSDFGTCMYKLQLYGNVIYMKHSISVKFPLSDIAFWLIAKLLHEVIHTLGRQFPMGLSHLFTYWMHKHNWLALFQTIFFSRTVEQQTTLKDKDSVSLWSKNMQIYLLSSIINIMSASNFRQDYCPL